MTNMGDTGILDAMGTAVMVIDPLGSLVGWNVGAESLYGWTADEMIGTPAVEFLGIRADVADHESALGQVLAGGSHRGWWWCTGKGAIYEPSYLVFTPQRDGGGAVLGIVGVALVASTHGDELLARDEILARMAAMPSPPRTETFTYDASGTITEVSSGLCRRLGVDADGLIGTSVVNLVDPLDAAVVRAELVKRDDPPELGPLLMRLTGAEGVVVPFEAFRSDRLDDPRINGILWHLRDLSDMQLVDRTVEESELRFRSIVETAEEGIWTIDHGGIVTFANPKMAELLGTTVDQIQGRSFLCHIGEADRARASARLARQAERGEQGGDRYELSLVRSDASICEALISASPLRSEGDTVTGVLQMVTDITDRKYAERENIRLVMEDALTGLSSRALVIDRIRQILAHHQREPGLAAVLFLDLDNFKRINDSLGHGVGDRLLIEEARRVQSVLRPEDTVGRFGGDEFVVVLDHLGSVDQAMMVADRISELVRQPVVIDGMEVATTVSIGVASTPCPDAETLMRDADAAMYRAKERGGNCHQMFDSSMRAQTMERLDLEHELVRAIGEGEFRVHYQPVVTLDGQIVSFEALARWDHPTRGAVSPGEFIPLAEATGAINALGAWVLDQACRDLSRWRAQPGCEGLTVAVNLSGRQLADLALPELVADTLASHHLDGRALWLEMTESVLMDDAAAVTAALTAIHAQGVNLAVDDFGTGYSSLLYLRRFPVDALKLDRFFVAGMDQSEEDLVIVRTVIELAHSLNLLAIGEGIETETQRSCLTGLGCDFAQGFLWSPGVPAVEVDALLRLRTLLPSPTGASDGPASLKQVPSHAPVDPSDRMSVLLVDDSPSDRLLLSHQLVADGSYDVVGEAPDGPTAVALTGRLHPDVVLLDMAMPGMNGLEALPLLLETSPTSRVVIFSGYLSKGLREQAMAAGAASIFEKGMGYEGVLEHLSMLNSDWPGTVTVPTNGRPAVPVEAGA